MTRFMTQVVNELKAMKAAGMAVPDLALKLAQDDETMCDKHYMDISECADLLCELAEVK
jgi:hypothetical protein